MVKSKIKFLISSENEEIKNEGRWSNDEQQRFLEACYFYKNDWEKIKNYIQTRTIPQIRSHAQKYLIKLCRKYSIKLFTKKFPNKISKHLNTTKISKNGKENYSKMSIYDKNILDMFKYYNREFTEPSPENSLNTVSYSKDENYNINNVNSNKDKNKLFVCETSEKNKISQNNIENSVNSNNNNYEMMSNKGKFINTVQNPLLFDIYLNSINTTQNNSIQREYQKYLLNQIYFYDNIILNSLKFNQIIK